MKGGGITDFMRFLSADLESRPERKIQANVQ